MTTRAEFERWASKNWIDGLPKMIALRAWEASRVATLEEAAKVCDERAEMYWKAYKKSPIDRPERANPNVEGMSDGAGNCAAHIRALAKSEGEK